jgi:monoamine oxidase
MQNLTRRNFVKRVGQAGGIGAAYLAMQGLGLSPVMANEPASVVGLKPGVGKGKKIIVLGAGMAGLAAAYELKKGGYDVVLLEARDRPTGRAWTISSGEKVELLDGVQNCTWEKGHYLNPGPARIPSHHQTILGYIKELNVPIEVEVNASRSAYMWNKAANGGKPMLMRAAINDTRGYVSELLAKAVNQGALDKDLTGIDKEKMVSFLRQYGDLSPDLFYKGSQRSGYKEYPGAADEVGVAHDPLTLQALLDQNMWGNVLSEEAITQQATMFQPVGGIAETGKAIAKALGPSVVKLMSEVTELRKTPTGVKVVYKDRATSKKYEVTGDYCISTIALHLLSRIPNDLSKDIQDGISKVTGGGEGMKIGFESRRFWEQDYQLYGGLSFSKDPTATLWTPSGGYHTPTGITVFYGGIQLKDLPRPEQFEAARAAWDGAFPGHGKELTKPIGVQWSKVPYNEGAGAHFGDDTKWLYDRLNQPDGPVYFAADYLSHVSGWQEGAIRSGHRAAKMINEKVQATKPA